MRQFLQFLQGIPIQAYVVFAIFAFSMLGSVIKKANEVKQKRANEIERQRRIQESMRTGRPIPDPAAEQAQEVEARKERLAEMQQRRQAQIEELRNRRRQMLEQQAAKQRGQTQGQPQGQASQTPSPQGQATQSRQRSATPVPSQARTTGIITATAPSTSGATATPVPFATQTARSAPPARRAPASPHPTSHPVSQAAGLSGKGSGPHATLHESEQLHRIERHHLKTGIGAKPNVPAGRSSTNPYGTPMERHGIEFKNQHDLRRAIIMSEILAKPVSQRPDHLSSSF